MAYTLKIVSIIRETIDAVTICFKQPALRKIHYKPGQYITLILTINKLRYRRAYSLSSTPGIDSTLNITVKRVKNGIVSNYINDKLKVDDLVEIMAPIGNFCLSEQPDQDVVFWGAGSGVTPLFSMLKSVLLQQENSRATLVYCNRNKAGTIFYAALNKLTAEFPGRLDCLYYFSTETDDADKVPFYPARLTMPGIEQVFKQVNPAANHYICGPAELKSEIIGCLTGCNVSSSQIFSEEFEHVVNEADLADVHTQTLTIVNNEGSHTIEVVRGMSILQAALSRQLDLPYSCQTGNCTLCKGKLSSGRVKKIADEEPLEELDQDTCLLCCSYPLTDDVIIEVY